jgi:hypothetical protein
MKNWLNPSDAAELLLRLDGLNAAARPRWGRFTAGELLCHLADPVRLALGDKQAKRVPGPLGLPGVAQAVVWILPWPKGAPTATEFLPGGGMTHTTTFEEDKQALLAVLRRFGETPSARAFAPHPVFGRLSRRGWGRLMWRHVDHHLRQFGL